MRKGTRYGGSEGLTLFDVLAEGQGLPSVRVVGDLSGNLGEDLGVGLVVDVGVAGGAIATGKQLVSV